MTIKFQQFAVVNTATKAKARVWYSLDKRANGVKSVTVYHKDYGRQLGEVFADVACAYENDTDTQTDYFDKGRVELFEGHALYAAARERAEANEAKRAAKYA
jgi:hypothetical protein